MNRRVYEDTTTPITSYDVSFDEPYPVAFTRQSAMRWKALHDGLDRVAKGKARWVVITLKPEDSTDDKGVNQFRSAAYGWYTEHGLRSRGKYLHTKSTPVRDRTTGKVCRRIWIWIDENKAAIIPGVDE